ncbi:hypothetical protein ESCO_006142 [Escovopsis weberi]|uniref:GPI anchored protein n=1 Tax=Escovopsis weberi TaxID=150374 RepID=A0A0M9VUN9_ESCWE|nr:hypothetical protein ESCO_006142 [Escovopsis weberi]
MAPISRVILATLALCLSDAVAGDSLPTAIKKQHPDSSEKIHLRDLDFAPLIPRLPPLEAAAARLNTSDTEIEHEIKHEHEHEGTLRRAAEALARLQRRTSCPLGMTSCDDIGSPDKCCPAGTYCTSVQDQSVGHVACCPNGATCGGGVGSCPAGAASCAAELGGGCCIPGYVCQGTGCVPSDSATVTVVAPPPTQTITMTQTTIVAGNPTTVVVTLTITQTAAPPTFTRTETETQWLCDGRGPLEAHCRVDSPSDAYRFNHRANVLLLFFLLLLLIIIIIILIVGIVYTQSGTQTGCPTGFYGCSAVHGGGCCRTERDCGVLSCPVPSSTIITHGVTVVVPASDVPATATSTCAGGWFLCGSDAGPVPGCCPSGWACGTASCFAKRASSTSQVQKDAPAKNAAAARGSTPNGQAFRAVMGSLGLLLAVLI